MEKNLIQRIKDTGYLVIDIETRSIRNLKKCSIDGSKTSVQHYSEVADIICLCIYNSRKNKYYEYVFYDCDTDSFNYEKIPKWLLNWSGYIVAHNYSFEYQLLKNVLTRCKIVLEDQKPSLFNLDRWLCTYTTMLQLGLNKYSKLELAGKFFNLSEGKQSNIGNKLINKYSVPSKRLYKTYGFKTFLPIPKEDLTAFVTYCTIDVKVTKQLFLHTFKLLSYDKFIADYEQSLFNVYKKTNERGIVIDTKSGNFINSRIKDALKIYEMLCEKQFGLTKAGGLVVNSTKELKIKLNKLLPKHLKVKDVQSETLDYLLDHPEINKKNTSLKISQARQLIIYRKFLGSQAIKKVSAMSSYKELTNSVGLADGDNVVKNFIQFNGAHTGRPAGRDLQVQNLFRSSHENFTKAFREFKQFDLSDVEGFYTYLRKFSRQLIIPEKNRNFVVADFSGVEARIAYWLIGSQKWLNIYKEYDLGVGPDPYVSCAANDIFNKPVNQILDIERQVGKETVLGANYGLSGRALHIKLRSLGIDVKNKIIIKVHSVNKKTQRLSKHTITKDISDHEVLAGMLYDSEATKEANSILKASKSDKLIICFKHGIETIPQTLEVPIKNKGTLLGVYIEQHFDCGGIIKNYRDSLPELRDTWKKFEEAFFNCLDYDNFYESVKLPFTEIGFHSTSSYINIILPSKRRLFFWKSEIKRSSFYGSKIFQNVVQSISRDIAAQAIINIDKHQLFNYNWDVHDELIADTAKCRSPKEKTKKLDKFIKIMEQDLSWAPGLKIVADGKILDRYCKI